jgi:dsRNA-specific ribonuclease
VRSDLTLYGRALLKAESAIVHINHFCDTLPHLPYVDLRPAFTFSEDKKTQLINATVILPSCLSFSVRRTSGLKWWQTEHAAMKDAAFQAYVALYKAGLLTDNLLPFGRERMVEGDAQEKLPSTIEIHAQFNPWVELAKAWAQPNFNQIHVSIQRHNEGKEGELRMVLTVPSAVPSIRPFTLYWDSDTTFTASLGSSQQVTPISSDCIGLMRDITHTLLRPTHSDYMPNDRKDFIALFAPEMLKRGLENWLKANRGRRLALQQFHLDNAKHSLGLVRTSLLHGIPHIFHQWRTPTDVDQFDESEIHIECLPLARRRNFLRCTTLSDKAVDLGDEEIDNNPHRARLFPAHSCTIDLLPFEQAKFGLFIPSILQHVEVLMVANQLRQTILKDVHFDDIQHVVEAITAPSAQWATNYQRYEFLGDSILKFVVSSQLFVDHKNWHEGYLSKRRACLVSNTCLASAALDAGLDAFILTKPFSPRQWTPPLISNVASYSTDRRNISSKTLADVVEALVGAAFIDGGLSAAIACIHTFLPDIHIQSPGSGFGGYRHGAKSTNLPTSANAELLIGYRFLNKTLLLEATTHPSYERDAITESYQRLEFLGDAVLDMIIVSVLSKHKPHRSHGDMTVIKAALVNADLLAFFCMKFSITYDVVNIEQKGNREFREAHVGHQMELWRCMRHHSEVIMTAQQACLRRYQDLRQEIEHFLKRGNSYPWPLLAQLNADKFFSDIIESILGAIFVDSGGSLADCQRFAERIGIIPYLLRILKEDIKIVHPKTALERLAGSGKIDYVVECKEDTLRVYRCLVRINSVDVIAVEECLTKDEAIVRAADAAVKLLSSQNHIFLKKYR